MKYSYVIVWFAVTYLATVYGQIVYLHTKKNASVDFSCKYPHEDVAHFAFGLNRVLAQPKEVLYLNVISVPVIRDVADNHRIVVHNDRLSRSVNVSIAHLRGRDTDMYHCIFYYEAADFYNRTADKFFLHVEDPVLEPCICKDYKLLVYSLSAAAGLLFLCVLGFSVASLKKLSSHAKALTVPVYEEMNGVRQAKAHIFPNLQPAEGVTSNRCIYAQPQKENPYMNHDGPSDPASELKPFNC